MSCINERTLYFCVSIETSVCVGGGGGGGGGGGVNSLRPSDAYMRQ